MALRQTDLPRMFLRTKGKIGEDCLVETKWFLGSGSQGVGTVLCSTCHFHCQPVSELRCFVISTLYSKCLVDKTRGINVFGDKGQRFHVDKSKDFCISLYTSISACQNFFIEFYTGTLA